MRLAALALGVGLVAAPASWVVTDRLERRNAFCVSCHLDAGTRLHGAKLRDAEALPPQSLAAAHFASASRSVSDRTQAEAPSFRCIDCHGGVGPVGRARVKAISARDGLLYLVGHFAEPEAMRFPLRDADCRQCHERFEARRAAFGDPLFHQVPAHQGDDFAVRCVGCHEAHEPGLPDHDFLRPAAVRARCARCHPEFEEEWS